MLILFDEELTSADKLEQLQNLQARVDSVDKSDSILDLWLGLQKNLYRRLANFSPPAKALEYRRRCGEQIRRLIQWNENHGRQSETWTYRNLAVNLVAEGNLFLRLGKKKDAQRTWFEALNYLRELSDGYPLNTQYRADKIELQLIVANLERESGDRKTAFELYTDTAGQLALTMKLNPKDHALIRRSAQVQELLGDLLMEMDEVAQATEAFTLAATLADQAANHQNSPTAAREKDRSYGKLLRQKASTAQR